MPSVDNHHVPVLQLLCSATAVQADITCWQILLLTKHMLSHVHEKVIV